MADLTPVDKRQLELLLISEPGYILDFTDRTFQEFILDSTQIDIDEEKYRDRGDSKANRWRSFLRNESNAVVGRVLWDLVEYAKVLEISSNENLLNDCFDIAQKLLNDREPSEPYETPSVKAHFEEIQKEIIEYIKSARFLIWVAVAWFTDKEIFDELVAKRKEGLNIQLIIMNDDINGNSNLPYESEFETYRVSKTEKYENIMHEKFCVIDLQLVIHGSYNWTRKARFNQESISVIKNRQNAELFAERFIQLKK
jgi:phosphatidylserine/phosphatidylglycerophosphate/cardiolipin synthase-like enzyme